MTHEERYSLSGDGKTSRNEDGWQREDWIMYIEYREFKLRIEILKVNVEPPVLSAEY